MAVRENTSGSIVRGNFTSRFYVIGGQRDLAGDAAVQTQSASYDEAGRAGYWPTGMNYVGPFRGKHGAAQGILTDFVATYYGDSGWTREMQTGIAKSDSSGSLGDACLVLNYTGFWRFRWAVKSGTRILTVQASQNSTGSFRPSVIIKKNPSIGINNDVSASAPDGAGYVTVGPMTITPTALGYVWVELHNNAGQYPMIGYLSNGSGSGETSWPCLFDHIVTA